MLEWIRKVLDPVIRYGFQIYISNSPDDPADLTIPPTSSLYIQKNKNKFEDEDFTIEKNYTILSYCTAPHDLFCPAWDKPIIICDGSHIQCFDDFHSEVGLVLVMVYIVLISLSFLLPVVFLQNQPLYKHKPFSIKFFKFVGQKRKFGCGSLLDLSRTSQADLRSYQRQLQRDVERHADYVDGEMEILRVLARERFLNAIRIRNERGQRTQDLD